MDTLNQYLIIEKELFKITAIRKDGKIYFQNINNPDDSYTTNLQQINIKEWIHLINVTLYQAKSHQELN